MSFFDAHPRMVGNFLAAEEKSILIDEGVPFVIQEVSKEEEGKYGPRFIVGIDIPEGVDGVEAGRRKVGFPIGTVNSRDVDFANMKNWLAEGNEIEPVVLELNGRSQILRKAE